LEYAVGAATVGISWSRYLVRFLEGFDVHLPHSLTLGPWDGGIVNLPAVFIIVLMSSLLIKGTKESAFVNGFIVALKVSVVLIFIFLGWTYINNENYDPYIPANTGTSAGSKKSKERHALGNSWFVSYLHGIVYFVCACNDRRYQLYHVCRQRWNCTGCCSH
jgi:amino acid transporter